MTGDAKDYKFLTPAEKRMYDLVLSQLILWILYKQTTMDNINPYITAPEINACLSVDNLMKKQIIVNLMQLWLSQFLIIQTKSMICGKMIKLREKTHISAEVYKNLAGEITDEKFY